MSQTKPRVLKEYTFTELDVRKWCEQADDSNELHLGEQAAKDSPFSERIVPGMMLLDKVSGRITQYGDAFEPDSTVILAGVVAARFREPVLFDETVVVSAEKVEEDNQFTYLDFEVHVVERDVLCAHGTVSVVID